MPLQILTVAAALAVLGLGSAPTPSAKTYSMKTSLVRPRNGGRPSSAPARDILVVTPPGYDDPQNATRRYPTLYLLHGAPGAPANFVKLGDWPGLLQKNGFGPFLLVIPDGMYAGQKEGDSEWADSADGRDRFETLVARELVAWTDSHFRTLASPSGRLLGGVSEGGYGAVNIALRNPGVFGSVVALSGYYDNDGSGWARPAMGSDPAFLRANSPLRYAADPGRADAWKTTRFYLGAGDSEARYTDETKAMAAKLISLGLPNGSAVTLRLMKGKHGWELWNALFLDALRSLPLPSA